MTNGSGKKEGDQMNGGTKRVSRWTKLTRMGGVAASMSIITAACGSTSSASAPSGGATSSVPANYATFALASGDTFSWMLPLPNQANYEPWDQNAEYGMYRPLLFAGKGTQPIIDYSSSLANPPVYSNNNQTVTVSLKPYKWSNGLPVTARDVQFFWNLYTTNKSQIATYVPGNFPDNVTSFTVNSPTTFTLQLKGPVNPVWFTDNQLTDFVPLPQAAWDKTSLTGKVGNYDLTTAGAKAVFKFLSKQSSEVGTYATNPIWQVVDGPWKIQSYNATTSRTVFQRNNKFSGKLPKLSGYILESYPSQTSEIDALRSGSLDYGYLPLSDYGLLQTLKSSGFTIAPWQTAYVQWAELGYTSPTYGPLVKQLYIRQALQHLINGPLYLKTTLHGNGQLAYGPVPNIPGSPYVTPQEKTDPYPYSTSAAKQLIASHGWTLSKSGVFTCTSPGTGANQCGPGIANGKVLNLLFMYQTGSPTLTAQVEAFSTAAASAGIGITLDPQSETSMYSTGGVCPNSGPCNWGIILYQTFLWNYGQGTVLPTAGQAFGTGNYWGGGYSSPTAERLIQAAHTQPGLNPLFAVENYLSTNVAGLWFPSWDWQISVVSKKLHGWNPQQIFGDARPSHWYFS